MQCPVGSGLVPQAEEQGAGHPGNATRATQTVGNSPGQATWLPQQAQLKKIKGRGGLGGNSKYKRD